MIRIQTFTLLFCLYAFISLIIYFTSAFTTLGWLSYMFSVLPVYLVFAAYFITSSFRHYQKRIQVKIFLLLPMIAFQILMIISSPANCYSWSQGRSCYSLIQVYLSHDNLNVIQGSAPHWVIAESLFPIFLLLHLASVVFFSTSAQVERV